MKFDIIGDIHGQAGKLERLLVKLGYREKNGFFSKYGHQAVFLGDFIDRGPEQARTLKIVRSMVSSESALAVMGNHEYNAIAWHTPDPSCTGVFLRTRNGSKGRTNREHHSAFLREFESSPSKHEEMISWFLTLPLWLDLPGFRAVHACWHGLYISKLEKYMQESRVLSRNQFFESTIKNSKFYLGVNAVLKGVEVNLPEGIEYLDSAGKVRGNVRTAWWSRSAKTLRDIALVDKCVKQVIPDSKISHEDYCAYDNLKPVFFGHYWMSGELKIQSAKIACLDYSGEPTKPIVAYRWDGECDLISGNFTQCV